MPQSPYPSYQLKRQQRQIYDAIAAAARGLSIGGGGGGVTLPITNDELAPMPAQTLKGNATGDSTTPQDLTVAEVLAMLGVSPSSGGLLPLVNGDLPGPTLMADPYGQCIGVPV